MAACLVRGEEEGRKEERLTCGDHMEGRDEGDGWWVKLGKREWAGGEREGKRAGRKGFGLKIFWNF